MQILKEKHIINEEEASRFIERYRSSDAGKERKNVITIIPEDKDKEYMEKITKQVTQKVSEDLNKIKLDINHISDEMQAHSQTTNQEVETIKKKIDEDISDQLRKSSWAQRIRWGGDIRLRYQEDYFDKNNADLLKPDNPSTLMNTKEDRSRGRIRIRLKAEANVLDKNETRMGKVDVLARVATGNDKDPVSTNDTFGDYYNKNSFVLDQAYIKWTYKAQDTIMDMIPQMVMTGGRLPNPFFCSDLVWDSDVNFEGLALNLVSDTELSNPWKAFLNLGVFPLQEVELSQDDKWLYAAQVGIGYEDTMGPNLKLGLSFYDYENIKGKVNDPLKPNVLDYTAPLYQQKGNTLFDIDPSNGIKTALAADYKLLNITGELDYVRFHPIHLIFLGDYVRNIGFDSKDVAKLTGNTNVSKEIEGWQVGLTVGYPWMWNFADWNVFIFYKHLEADAVLDAFTDSDFHSGGTNAQGWRLGGRFVLYKDIWLEAQWISTDEINGPPLSIDTLMLNINARF
uniref:Outer membrane receptor for ferric coprogen and ferric-rhodotorulic acid n=1 Tax=uncultured Desulfobacterium sp. TaxID=201089 RepID=E1YK28_9BACT|nr:hypothetical protein N47_E51440 [uncultured Desulfobacterium sp.]